MAVLPLSRNETLVPEAESPSVAVMERFAAKGASLSYHDPYVKRVDLRGTELTSLPLTDQILAEQECVLILTAHPGIDTPNVIRL